MEKLRLEILQHRWFIVVGRSVDARSLHLLIEHIDLAVQRTHGDGVVI